MAFVANVTNFNKHNEITDILCNASDIIKKDKLIKQLL